MNEEQREQAIDGLSRWLYDLGSPDDEKDRDLAWSHISESYRGLFREDAAALFDDQIAPLLAEERRAGAEQALRGAAVATMPSDTDSRCRASLSRWLVVRADRIAQDQP